MSTSEGDRPDGAEGQPEPRLHGELLTGSLLALLRNWNAHGYQLAQRLVEAGLPAFDAGTVYRTLRQLERTGMVSSFWDTSPSGPARRIYSLTKAGDIFLSTWIDVLQRYQTIVHSASEAYEESATSPNDEPPPANRQGPQHEA